jgi:hypothetical protein
MILSFAPTFGDRIVFIFEKHSEMYIRYIEVSIAEEKTIIAQKLFQYGQLRWMAGKRGVKC